MTKQPDTKTLRTNGGGPKTYVFEVGPLETFDFSAAENRRSERQMRRDMEALLRDYLAVGQRSKFVRSEIRDA